MIASPSFCTMGTGVVQIVLGPLREPAFPIAIFERFVMVITLSGAAFG